MKTTLLSIILIGFATQVLPQTGNGGIPLIGSKAPSFTAISTEGSITFPDDFGDKWKILFSHPRDFTPVCTSEVLQLARMKEEFDALGVKIAVVSSDDVAQHEKWKKSIEAIKEAGKEQVNIRFPLIDDHRAEVAGQYGMLHEKSRDVRYARGVFIISPDNTVEVINFYPMKVGRNFEEIKRTVIALQTVNAHQSTPANWHPGDDLLLPASPYLNPGNSMNEEMTQQYYNVGEVLWYKKTGKDPKQLVPDDLGK